MKTNTRASSASNRIEFANSFACTARVHCRTCRTSQSWRDALRQHFNVPDNFDQHCPHGVTIVTLAATNEHDATTNADSQSMPRTPGTDYAELEALAQQYCDGCPHQYDGPAGVKELDDRACELLRCHKGHWPSAEKYIACLEGNIEKPLACQASFCAEVI